MWGLHFLLREVYKWFCLVGSHALPAMLFKLVLVLCLDVFLMSPGKCCILHQLHKFYKLCRYLLCHSFSRTNTFINNVGRWLRNSSSRALIYTIHLPEIALIFSGASIIVSAQAMRWFYQNFTLSSKFVCFEYLKRQDFPATYCFSFANKEKSLITSYNNILSSFMKTSPLNDCNGSEGMLGPHYQTVTCVLVCWNPTYTCALSWICCFSIMFYFFRQVLW